MPRKWKADSCALSVNKSGLLDKRLLEVLERNLRFEIGHLMLRKWGGTDCKQCHAFSMKFEIVLMILNSVVCCGLIDCYK